MKILSTKQRNLLLIIVCTIVYSCSYLLKLGYNANIICFEKEFGIQHAETGLVTTFFFVAYGIGQVVNGFLVRKYPLKYIVPGALLVSCVFNVLLGTTNTFVPVKYYWLVNGAILSILWPSVIRMVGENVDPEYKNKSIFFLGLTTAIGTLATYGLSALFTAVNHYRIIYFVAVGLAVIFSLLWFFTYDKMKKEIPNEPVVQESKYPKKERNKYHVLVFIGIIALYCIATALAKEGLQTWLPAILIDKYHYDESVSILITVLLPLTQMFGASLAIQTNKKIKNYILLCSVFSLVPALFVGLDLAIKLNVPVFTIIMFALSCLILSAAANVTTSMIPIRWEDPKKSGFYAGLFNGFCFVGSAISSFGLGAVADNYGWDLVSIILICCLCAVSIVGLAYLLIRIIIRYK